MTKRMLSLVLVLAMVLTLFAGLTLTTHAAEVYKLASGDLETGDNVIVALKSGDAYYALPNANKSSSASIAGTALTVTGDVATATSAVTFEVYEDASGNVGLKSTEAANYLGLNSAKLACNGWGNTKYLTFSDQGNGLYKIESANNAGRGLTTSGTNFTCSNSDATPVYIFKLQDDGSSGGSHTHSWGNWYSNNNGTHSRDCDDPDGDCPDPTETVDCTYGATTVVTAATCSSVGSGTHTCTVCGYTETVEIPVDANAHNWEWDGNEGANGTHGLECANCGATSTEACVDTDDDDVCDICGADIPALTTATGDIVFADLGLTNSQQYTDPFTSSNGYFTVQFGGGGNDGKYYNTGTGIRVYSGGHMTVTATSGTITKVEINCSGTGYMPTSNSTIDSGSISFDGTKATWTGDAASVTFTRESASNHWRIQSVSVTVSLASGSHVHSWGSWYTNNDGTHSRDCDDPDGDCPDPTETVDCTYGATTVVTAATCSSVGSGTHTCTVCGYTETVEIPIDANAHVWEWDGNEGANGTHGLECANCGATSTEACVDTDDDSICDVCGADIPVPKTYTLNTELHDGDEVVIVYTASNMALTATASGAKLAGVAVTPSNGELTVELGSTVAVLTVEMIDGDANNSFYLKSSDGKYLTSAASGNGVSFADDASDCGKWYLRNVNTTNNTVGLMNAGANFNGNYNQGLEYYSGFTTYGWKDNNSAYVFSLYTIVNQAAHVHDWDQGTVTTPASCTATGVMTYECQDCGDTREEAIPMIAHADGNGDGLCDSCGGTIYNLATVLNEGDSVVIYHPVSKTALTKTASGTRLVAEAANGQSGVIAVGASSDIAVLTVEYVSGSTTDFYLIDADGNYLTTGETGNSLTLEATATDYSIWTLTAVDTSNCLIINKNAAYNSNQIAVEYYTTFNGYSWKDNGDTAFYMELYTIPAPTVTVRDISAGYSLSTDASIVINLHLTGLEAGDVVMIDSTALTPAAAITGTDDVYTYAVDAKDLNKTFTLTIKDGNDDPLTINGVDSLEVSARNYVTAEASDDTKGDDGETTVADVVKSMGNYGEYAKKYFTERDTNDTYDIPATSLYGGYAFSNQDGTDLAAYATSPALTKTSENKAVNKFSGASLLLESELTIRFYFAVPNADVSKISSVTVNGTDAAAGTYGKLDDKDNYIYVDVKVGAADLDRENSVTLVYNGVTASVSGYTALRYLAKTLATSTDDNLNNLCKALYVYYKMAKGYFG